MDKGQHGTSSSFSAQHKAQERGADLQRFSSNVRFLRTGLTFGLWSFPSAVSGDEDEDDVPHVEEDDVDEDVSKTLDVGRRWIQRDHPCVFVGL